MPQYILEDPKTGRRAVIESDTPPTDADFDDVFSYGGVKANLESIAPALVSGLASGGAGLYKLAEMRNRYSPTALGIKAAAYGFGKLTGQEVVSPLDEFAETNRELSREGSRMAQEYAEKASSQGANKYLVEGLKLLPQIIPAAGVGAALGGPAGLVIGPTFAAMQAFGSAQAEGEEANMAILRSQFPDMPDKDLEEMARLKTLPSSVPQGIVEGLFTRLFPYGADLIKQPGKIAAKAGTKAVAAKITGAQAGKALTLGVLKESAEELLTGGSQRLIKMASYEPESNPLGEITPEQMAKARKSIDPAVGPVSDADLVAAIKSGRWDNLWEEAKMTAALSGFFGGAGSAISIHQQNTEINERIKAEAIKAGDDLLLRNRIALQEEDTNKALDKLDESGTAFRFVYVLSEEERRNPTYRHLQNGTQGYTKNFTSKSEWLAWQEKNKVEIVPGSLDRVLLIGGVNPLDYDQKLIYAADVISDPNSTEAQLSAANGRLVKWFSTLPLEGQTAVSDDLRSRIAKAQLRSGIPSGLLSGEIPYTFEYIDSQGKVQESPIVRNVSELRAFSDESGAKVVRGTFKDQRESIEANRKSALDEAEANRKSTLAAAGAVSSRLGYEARSAELTGKAEASLSAIKNESERMAREGLIDSAVKAAKDFQIAEQLKVDSKKIEDEKTASLMASGRETLESQRLDAESQRLKAATARENVLFDERARKDKAFQRLLFDRAVAEGGAIETRNAQMEEAVRLNKETGDRVKASEYARVEAMVVKDKLDTAAAKKKAAVLAELKAKQPPAISQPKQSEAASGAEAWLENLHSENTDAIADILKGRRGAQDVGAVVVELPARVLAAVSAKGALIFYRSTRDFSQWSARMIKEFGAGISPHLNKIYSSIQDPSLFRDGPQFLEKANFLDSLNILVREDIKSQTLKKAPPVLASPQEHAEARAIIAKPLSTDRPRLTNAQRSILSESGKEIPPKLIESESKELSLADTNRSMFSTTRGVTRRLAQKYQEALGFVREQVRVADWNTNELNNALLKDYGVKYGDLSNDSRGAIDSVLRRETPSSSLPTNTANAVELEMAHRDLMAQSILSVMPDAPADLVAKIVSNSGYLHRSYRAFTQSGWIQDLAKDTEGGRTPTTEAGKALNRKVANLVAKRASAGKPSDVEQARNSILRKLQSIMTGPQSVAGISSQPIIEVDSSGELVSVNAGKEDSDVLKRRNKIDEDYRLMLGEETDPQAKYLETIRKVAQAVTYRKWVADIIQDGLGSGLISRKESNVAGHTVALQSKVSSGDDPMSGYYTDPEYAAVLQAFNETVNEVGPLLRAISDLTMFAKLNMTVGSLTYMPQQIWGALSNLIMVGAPLSLVNLPARTVDVLRNEFGTTSASQIKAHLRYIRLGITDDTNLDTNSYEIIREIVGSNKTPIEAARDLVKASGKKGLKVFSSVDNALKIVLFHYELNAIQEAYPSISLSEAETLASERTAHKSPSKHTLPKVFKYISELRFVGDFLSFHTLLHYNLFQNIRYGLLDIKNPKMRVHGIKTLIGSAAVIFSADALTAMFEAIAGTEKTEEEERAFRAAQRPWARNADFFFYRDEKGRLKGQNLTIINPLAALRMSGKELLSSFKGEQSITEGFIQGSIKMLEPYTNQGAVASAIADISRGETGFGRKIYEDYDESGTKMVNSFNHLVMKTLVPATIVRYYKNIKPATEGEQRVRGASSSPSDMWVRELTGLEPSRLNPEIALRDAVVQFNRTEGRLNSLFLKELTGPEYKTPNEIRESYSKLESARRKLFLETSKSVADFAKAGNMSRATFNNAFMQAGARSDIGKFTSGNYVPYKNSPELKKRILEANKIRIESGRESGVAPRLIAVPSGMFSADSN